MAIIVEDGTVVAGANSYVTESALIAYALDRGIALNIEASQLLIRAMDWIEVQKYKGDQVTTDQVLQWPRANVADKIYSVIYSDVIPAQLKAQQMYVATGIDQGFDPAGYHEQGIESETNCLGDKVTYLSGALDHYAPSTTANRFNELLRPRFKSYRV